MYVGSESIACMPQVSGFPAELLAQAGKQLQVGEVVGSGPGYFKLAFGAQPARGGHVVDAAGTRGALP